MKKFAALAMVATLAAATFAGCGKKDSGSDNTGTTPSTPMTGTTTTTVQEDFTLQEGHTGSTDEYGFSYTVEGSIKNNTNKQYSYVQVQYKYRHPYC